MDKLHSVQRLFFYFVVLAVLLWWACRNLWPSGLYVWGIRVILWKSILLYRLQ